MQKKTDQQDAVLGFEDKAGKETSQNTITPPLNVPIGTNVNNVKPAETVVVDDKKVFEKADVEAKFQGGINAFRNQVGQYFNQDSFEGTGDLMKTTVTFIVEKDGSISNVKAIGEDAYFNKEAIKTINSIKGKWTPAQVNGKNVRYAFKMPIAIQFD